ncbi:LOW QUALITY PROTEIN: hypothetical protein PanWU01x14_131340 [Parasponia andersonii]|uniref:Uncharacterized protein n=1 Tax=Parasponia andersonii TaxID=3476 RepID=A0A2P5CQY7_PARAD|nr:LOW QUALITY PROTEIN: hypothetical protein PanWU01x14_131340 [Parasponia andersonii]
MVTGPVDPVRSIRPRTRVIILRIIQSTQRKISIPLAPASRIDKTIHEGLHVNCSRILLPRPPQVGLRVRAVSGGSSGVGGQVGTGTDGAVLDRSACVLVRVGSALSSYGVELAGERQPRIDVAVLDNNSSVAEYEVHGAVNVAFSVELSLGMSIQGVLVGFEAAAVEC